MQHVDDNNESVVAQKQTGKAKKPKNRVPTMEGLEKLIGSYSAKINELKNEQNDIKAKQESTSGEFAIAASPESTYGAIEDLLETSLEIMAQLKIFIQSTPDAESFASAASMINSTQGLFNEFTSIWRAKLKQDNAIALEAVKLQNKKDLAAFQNDLKIAYYKATNNNDMGEAAGTKVPFNTAEFIKAMTTGQSSIDV